MSAGNERPLRPGPAAGWLRGGEVWRPRGPFYGALGSDAETSILLGATAAGAAARGLDRPCLPIAVEPGLLRELKESGAAHLAGGHVALPLRAEAAALCERLTGAAQATGAVDSLRIRDGRWTGNDASVAALHSVLDEGWPGDGRPTAATVLGCGPAARSAVRALVDWGVTELTVCDAGVAGETDGAGAARREAFRAWAEELVQAPAEDVRVSVVARTAGPRDAPREASLWINTLPTTVDLHPLLPVAAGEAPCLVVDLNLRPDADWTGLPLGFRHVGGAPLLLLRAALTFVWWFAPPIPWEALRGALTAD